VKAARLSAPGLSSASRVKLRILVHLVECSMGTPRWTVYCHTHVATGRRYIGLTKLTMMKRWNQHLRDSRLKVGKGCRHLWNAIRAYGKDAFSHEVLEICTNLEVANLAEKCWIELHDTRNSKKGFNLMRGGGHTPHPNRNPWDRPEYRVRSSAASKKKFENPAFRMSQIQRLKALADDPKNRAAVKAALNLPESKAKRSDISKEIRSRPEVVARMTEVRSSPEFKSRHREACSKAMSRPEVKEKVSLASKAMWADRRPTHCKRGHPLDDAYVGKNGNRTCRPCRKLRANESTTVKEQS